MVPISRKIISGLELLAPTGVKCGGKVCGNSETDGPTSVKGELWVKTKSRKARLKNPQKALEV
jgi:hypothetical protein